MHLKMLQPFFYAKHLKVATERRRKLLRVVNIVELTDTNLWRINLMKTVYKFLALSVMMAAFVIANASTSLAQDDREARKIDLYTKFTECYKVTDAAKKDVCYTTVAKPYLDEFEKDNDQYGAFVRKQYDAYVKAKEVNDRNERFNTSIKDPNSVNADTAYSSGREILAENPDLIDVPIVLASIGFDKAIANPPVDKYNNDAINNAKLVIQKIEAGKPSVTGNYGVFSYSYKTKDFPDGKNNTLGWMNYIIGYIMYNRLDQKKAALPYLYKASQLNSATKNIPDIYQAIGNYYVDEFIRLDKERVAKIEAAGNVDTEETKQLLALQRGYADRALESFARAYKIAGNDPKIKAYKDSLLSRAKELYAIRYNNDMSGFDTYLASVTNQPFTNPTTAVTPITAAEDTTTGSASPSSATTMTNTAATSSGSNTTRPANTTSNETKTTTTNSTPAKTNNSTPAKTTTPKKPSKR